MINTLGMFTVETHKLLLCNIQPVKDKLIVLTVKEGWHSVEINQLQHIKKKAERHHKPPFPLPSPSPCHHQRITGATGRTGLICMCFWRAVPINSHERGPSIQPASRDALQWVGLLSSPFHKTLSIEKKKRGGGVESPNVTETQMMPLVWVPASGEKGFSRVWSDLKDAGEGCLANPVWGAMLREGENGKVKCQASHHSIVCKIALNAMSAVVAKTKDAEHSFVTWWGSMCCGGAWGREVHQTSHAAVHHERSRPCSPLLARELCFHWCWCWCFFIRILKKK